MPIHCVHLDQFVLFNVEIQDTGTNPVVLVGTGFLGANSNI